MSQSAPLPDDELARLHAQLRAIARQRLAGERRDHTLQATALVNEAWIRLHGDRPFKPADQGGLLAAAAETMRRILIDHARARAAAKRGGGGPGGRRQRLELDAVQLAGREENEEILAVEEAILRLEQQDSEMARLVRLRFFGGLTEDEAARALGLSPRSARRTWAIAKAWLRRDLAGD